MKVRYQQVADVAMRVECLDEREADDDQRDHRDEQVQGDHDGQVLALDLLEPPDGFKRERNPWALLEFLLILPGFRYPFRKSPRVAVARFVHRDPLPMAQV